MTDTHASPVTAVLQQARAALLKIRTASIAGCYEGYGKPEKWADDLFRSHGDVAAAIKAIDALASRPAQLPASPVTVEHLAVLVGYLESQSDRLTKSLDDPSWTPRRAHTEVDRNAFLAAANTLEQALRSRPAQSSLHRPGYEPDPLGGSDWAIDTPEQPAQQTSWRTDFENAPSPCIGWCSPPAGDDVRQIWRHSHLNGQWSAHGVTQTVKAWQPLPSISALPSTPSAPGGLTVENRDALLAALSALNNPLNTALRDRALNAINRALSAVASTERREGK